MKRGTTDGTPNERKGYRDDAYRGTADGTPLRIKTGGAEADASPRPVLVRTPIGLVNVETGLVVDEGGDGE